MRNYTLLWFGQFVSLLGSSITSFALTIWAWQETELAVILTTVGFFAFLPVIIVSPFAGVIVDRWSRKAILIWSDTASAVLTAILFALYANDTLAIWHLCALIFFSGVVGSFQAPAMMASVASLVPEKHRSRANAMRSISGYGTQIAAPFLAGILITSIGLNTIFFIDIVTFFVAILTLSIIAIPQPKQSQNSETKTSSIWEEMSFGLRYISKSPSLTGVIAIAITLNLLCMIGINVLIPTILARTNSNQAILGSLQSILGVGGLIGGFFISAWGGPKSKIHGVFIGITGSALSLILLGLNKGIVIWIVGCFLLTFFMPMIDAFLNTIYQNKIPSSILGRFFSTYRALSQIGTTMSYVVTGFLADYIFEPSMMPNGILSHSFSWLVGSGPGAGMGLMLITSGLLTVLVAASVLVYKPVRQIEVLLPRKSQTHSPPTEKSDGSSVSASA
ncbi:MAG: MFS transporter [Trueperaceae bacterium]